MDVSVHERKHGGNWGKNHKLRNSPLFSVLHFSMRFKPLIFRDYFPIHASTIFDILCEQVEILYFFLLFHLKGR